MIKEISYLAIEAKEVRTVKEVIRSDGLWCFACGDFFLFQLHVWFGFFPKILSDKVLVACFSNSCLLGLQGRILGQRWWNIIEIKLKMPDDEQR